MPKVKKPSLLSNDMRVILVKLLGAQEILHMKEDPLSLPKRTLVRVDIKNTSPANDNDAKYTKTLRMWDCMRDTQSNMMKGHVTD